MTQRVPRTRRVWGIRQSRGRPSPTRQSYRPRSGFFAAAGRDPLSLWIKGNRLYRRGHLYREPLMREAAILASWSPLEAFPDCLGSSRRGKKFDAACEFDATRVQNFAHRQYREIRTSRGDRFGRLHATGLLISNQRGRSWARATVAPDEAQR